MRNVKKYNFVYQTKNLINGKTYIGVRCTNNLNDGYIGCGVVSQKNAVHRKEHRKDKSAFVNAVVKYGYENFKREILCFFDTSEEAYEEEAWLVNEDCVKREDNYNVALGGLSGNRHPLSNEFPEELIEDYLKGVEVKDLIVKYKVSERCARRAVKGLRNTREYYITSNLNKFADALPEIKQNYENGITRIQLQRTYKIPYQTLKLFIEHFKWEVYKEVYIAVKDGLTETFISLKQFCKKYNIFEAGVRLVLKGKMSHYKGWRFYTKEDYESGNYIIRKPSSEKHRGLKFINPKGEIEEVTTNLSDFCKTRGLQSSSIYEIWNGKMKQHKGYKLWQEIH